jgi:cell division topological specificity factor
MSMLDFLQGVFGRESNKASKTVAKERLRLVLMHDRMDLSPQLLESLRADLLKVIADYCVIDEEAIELDLHREQGCVALVANIPVIKMKRVSQQN